ncbi:SpoIVB peptidase [Propionispora vibrioides]|jgi:stage IV sporulation protein B|uniref:Stage IV sporulation protein B n=1 Tax=Propionispora vibrioides TaxID=112903 RepID=A0A1H8NGN1_9FIRM|nr:SpoIVB peptidase [Propionispora vibrioides]SEO28764.1 stage IV sporulation protein B [Propionispora vibrioides]
MHKSRRRSVTGIMIVLLILSFCFSPQFRNIYNLPPHINMIEGETTFFPINFPLTIKIYKNTSYEMSSPVYAFSKEVALSSQTIGKTVVEFKLLGIFPLRSIQVDVIPAIKLIPGGHSIGVILHSHGVLVVGNSPVQNQEGQLVTPARDAGIELGDTIISINGVTVNSDAQVADIIDNSGKNGRPLQMIIKRNTEEMNVTVSPVLCNETRRYRIGLFVRDSAAGVGTLTFYEPKSRAYAALGHVIADSDTNQPIDCDQGKIVLATISGIQQGKRGQPGEKIGAFVEDNEIVGDIKKNTTFGIYGQMKTNLTNELYPEALPVASMNQVQTGPAEILTVIDNQKIEKFSVDIQKINLQEAPSSKGLVIKVTDPRLLEKTGGIIQGMSGSPIIQNGKLIGAVTHVFVHDPTKGYGCFIDWMLMESGLIPKTEKQTVGKLFTFSLPFVFM